MSIKTMDIVMKAVCEEFGFTKESLIGYDRHVEIMDARHMFCGTSFLRGYRVTEIGKFIRRNHCSIINSVKKFRNLNETDPAFKEVANRIMNRVEEIESEY